MLVTMTVVRQNPEGWSVELAALHASTVHKLADPVVLGIADDDAEIAEIHVSQVLGGACSVTSHLRWSRLARDRIREIRLRVARNVTRVSSYVESTDIELP